MKSGCVMLAPRQAKRLAEYVNGAKQFLVRAVEKSSGKDLGSLALDYNKWYPRLPAELKCIARVPVFGNFLRIAQVTMKARRSDRFAIRCFMLKSLSDTDLISSLKDSKLNDGSFNTLVPSLKGRLLYHQRTGLAWLSSLSAGSLIFREKHPLLQTAFSAFCAMYVCFRTG